MYTIFSSHSQRRTLTLWPEKTTPVSGQDPRPMDVGAAPSPYQTHNHQHIGSCILGMEKNNHQLECCNVDGTVQRNLPSTLPESLSKPPKYVQPPVTWLFGGFLHTLMVGIRSGGNLKAKCRNYFGFHGHCRWNCTLQQWRDEIGKKKSWVQMKLGGPATNLIVTGSSPSRQKFELWHTSSITILIFSVRNCSQFLGKNLSVTIYYVVSEFRSKKIILTGAIHHN